MRAPLATLRLATLSLATLGLATLGLAAVPVAAEDWVVDAEASSIRFVYAVDGRAAEGVFRTVEGEGAFDPAAPGATRLELRIAVRSLDLGDPLETGFALSAGWFDAGTFPVARYRLARLTPLGAGRWEALGDITIKGRTQVVRTPVTLDLGEDAARARAEVAFDRSYFGIGGDIGALFVDIGETVTVSIDLVARPEDA